jgi:hypothetical protein
LGAPRLKDRPRILDDTLLSRVMDLGRDNWGVGSTDSRLRPRPRGIETLLLLILSRRTCSLSLLLLLVQVCPEAELLRPVSESDFGPTNAVANGLKAGVLWKNPLRPLCEIVEGWLGDGGIVRCILFLGLFEAKRGGCSGVIVLPAISGSVLRESVF